MPLRARDRSAESHQHGPARPSFARAAQRGRGALDNPAPWLEQVHAEAFDDGWDLDEATARSTEVIVERPRTIITRNASPDIAFDRSINPYRGCEHGCAYCFARPTHAFQGLSSGLDFETRLFVRPTAPDLLAKELQAPSYQPATIALGSNTDPYQPIERRFRITRSLLDVLRRFNHPVGIVTKSGLVARDLDLLAPMADRRLAKVCVSITTLDPELARRMEPRAPSPAKRLATLRALAEAGIPTAVMVAPVVPGLTDHEIESICQAAYAAGAREAGYVLLRLPHDLRRVMEDWLAHHYPDKAARVLSLVEATRGGRTYDSAWGVRQTGVGPYAWMIGRRFEAACARYGLNRRRVVLRTDLFTVPGRQVEQLALF